MDTRSLRLICDVARLGSFAAAARRHGMDPSSVSRAVALVEDELGLRLFQRTTRRLTPTEAGAIYLRHADSLADGLDLAKEEAAAVSGTPTGTLRLTASVAFSQVCVVPLLGRFRALYPNLGVELLATDATLNLVADGVDLAIRLGPPLDSDGVVTRLMATRYRVCAAPSYLSTAPPLADPETLTDHRCVLFALPGFRHWRFRDRSGHLTEVAVAGDIAVSSALAVRGAARSGLGPALLADWMIHDDLATGRLVDVLPDWEVTATTFDTAAWALYPSRLFLPAKVRAAIDFLKVHLAR